MKLHKWKDIERSRFTDEERAAIKTRARAELLVEMNLPELRNALGKTQLEIAEAAEIAQANVSEFERRDDHMLSVLRRYIEALGGKLEVNAVFDDKRVRLKGV
jgi:DNA-binding XRE family transcriptional regulator